MVAVVCRCSRCGEETDWEESLGLSRYVWCVGMLQLSSTKKVI